MSNLFQEITKHSTIDSQIEIILHFPLNTRSLFHVSDFFFF